MRYFNLISHHNTTVISTADLKTHLRITFSEDDTYIASLEKAAVRMIEEYCNLYLISSDCVQFGNSFNDLNTLFKSPMITNNVAGTAATLPVVSYKNNGSWTVLSTNLYEVVADIKPAKIVVAVDSSLPDADDVFEAWKVEYDVGYVTATDYETYPELIPEPIKQAIKITVADMYENRQSVIVGKIVSEIPRTAQYLMDAYKIQTL